MSTPADEMLAGLTADDYTTAVVDLLPVGHAWNAARMDGTVMRRFWAGIAEEPTKWNARRAALLDESYPGHATELLPEWERFSGTVPNPCLELAQWTVEERRQLVLWWLALKGGASRAFFTTLAQTLGYTVDISEFLGVTYRAGMARAGLARVGSAPFWWIMTVHGARTYTYPRAGAYAAGEPLGGSGGTLLECIVRRFAPASSYVSFAYTA
jgi:uncharacterized protein YmfQ (DUF2313 family)